MVVRTYSAHDASLRRLVDAIQTQDYARWEMLLVIMDEKPFPAVHSLLREAADPRVWVYAEWVGDEFRSRDPDTGLWTPHYHTRLYALTDEAIRACPPDTRYVVVTNGDNLYLPGLFTRIAGIHAASRRVDLIALDYHSRYQRPTAPPCDRFDVRGAGVPACKRNELTFCKTDLGSYVLNWPRLIKENRQFGTLDKRETAIGHDGLMASSLVAAGWKVHHVVDACLYNHSPSPAECAATGGVWDDTGAAAMATNGGRCVNATEGEALGRSEDNEVVTVMVAGEPSAADLGSEGGSPPAAALAPMQCVRRKDVKAGTAALMSFFGLSCADKLDLRAFKGVKMETSTSDQARVTYKPQGPTTGEHYSALGEKQPSYRKIYKPNG